MIWLFPIIQFTHQSTLNKPLFLSWLASLSWSSLLPPPPPPPRPQSSPCGSTRHTACSSRHSARGSAAHCSLAPSQQPESHTDGQQLCCQQSWVMLSTVTRSVVNSYKVCCQQLQVMLSTVTCYVINSYKLCCQQLQIMLSTVASYVVNSHELCCQ